VDIGRNSRMKKIMLTCFKCKKPQKNNPAPLILFHSFLTRHGTVNAPAQAFFRRFGFVDDSFSPSVSDPTTDVDYDILSLPLDTAGEAVQAAAS
jgi:hypothetical protein